VTWTGGCQCGAVRFRVEGELGRASLCHCRMCQKAFAAPYGALVTVRTEHLVWTRGERSRFQSSNKIQRGFCNACGTPLSFEWGEEAIDLAVCAFDRAAELTPTVQLRRAQALSWALAVGDLPVADGPQVEAHDAGIVSHQHPDHDTPEWPCVQA
jgi:hypothetical protein